MMQVTKVWWDGNKMMADPIDPAAMYLPPMPTGIEALELFAALVRADERNSWPAEMEAMERQVNILTDALAQARADEREACANLVFNSPTSDEYESPLRAVYNAIRARGSNA